MFDFDYFTIPIHTTDNFPTKLMNFIEDKTSYEYKTRKLLTRMINGLLKDVSSVFKLDLGKIKYKLDYKEPCWSIELSFKNKEQELQVCCLNHRTTLESIYLDRVIDKEFHWDGLGNSYMDVRKFFEQSLLLLISDKPSI